MSKIKVSVGPFFLAEGSRGGSVLAFFPPISFFFFLDSFIYWLIWIFIATSRLFTAVFGLSLARASRCSRFSYCRAPAPVIKVHKAYLPCSPWNPTSLTRDQTCVPPLAGRFSTPGPPGTSHLVPTSGG